MNEIIPRAPMFAQPFFPHRKPNQEKRKDLPTPFPTRPVRV